MKKAKIKQIADFVKDTEEGLVELDFGRVGLQARLQELYRIIKRLMDGTFEANQEQKPLLALIELKARKCKQHIEKRLGIRN